MKTNLREMQDLYTFLSNNKKEIAKELLEITINTNSTIFKQALKILESVPKYKERHEIVSSAIHVIALQSLASQPDEPQKVTEISQNDNSLKDILDPL